MLETTHFQERCQQRGYSREWVDMAILNGDLLEQKHGATILSMDEKRAHILKKRFASVEGEHKHLELSLRRQKRHALRQGRLDVAESLTDAISEERFARKQARKLKDRTKGGFIVLAADFSCPEDQIPEQAITTVGKKYKKHKKIWNNLDK